MSAKKILILSSYGGYGHIAATNTLKKLLGDEYEMEVFYPIKELRFFKIPSAENVYNFLIANNFNRLTNWIVRSIMYRLFPAYENKLTRLIDSVITEKRPDLVISLIPFINYSAAESARLSDIPLLLVTTDNDLVNWVLALEKMKLNKFKVTIGHKLITTSGSLEKCFVSQEAIETVGLPLRPDFLNIPSKEKLRAQYEIPEHHNVVLIMMGGMGARSTYNYAKVLASQSMNLHLIVCTGKNRQLAKKIKSIQPAIGNIVDVIPFTEKVHELFGLADILITKPGPGSINEAYSVKLPILLDQTRPPLFWENANFDLVLSHKVGDCIHHYKDAPSLVKRFLFDEQTREMVNRAYRNIPENKFATSIKSLIEEMIEDVPKGEAVMMSCNNLPIGNE